MNKWIKAYKTTWGLSVGLTLFDKINFYIGRADHWGLGFDISFYDRSLTFNVLNIYFGVEIWHSDDGITDFVPRSKTAGDMLD